MNYAAFKNHVITFLWRTNDSDFDAAFDSLVRMAQARLKRDLRVEEMIAHNQIVFASSEKLTLPADYLRMITVSSGALVFTNVTKQLLEAKQRVNKQQYLDPSYHVTGRTLHLIGPMSAVDPIEFSLSYYRIIPDFVSVGNSWLADEYLDLLTYAVLTYAGDFLKDPQDADLYEKRYNACIESVRYDNADRMFAGSPLQMELPGIVG